MTSKAPTMRPGFQFTKFNAALVPRRVREWRSFVQLGAPDLTDNTEIVSLGDEYFVSLGAHMTHGILLMDRAAAQPLTLERALRCCALLSFILDSPVVPLPNKLAEKRYRLAGLSSFRAFQRSVHGSVEEYLEALSQAAQLTAGIFRPPERQLRFGHRLVQAPTSEQWPYVALPTRDETWRALMAYWSGLLSIAVPGRILNFWRSIEASTRDKTKRFAIFSALDRARVRPVWIVTSSFPANERAVKNLMVRTRRAALRHKNDLVMTHGTEQAAWDILYDMRRGKAAHADRNAIEYDQLHSLPLQARDSELLRYTARVAIERDWG